LLLGRLLGMRLMLELLLLRWLHTQLAAGRLALLLLLLLVRVRSRVGIDGGWRSLICARMLLLRLLLIRLLLQLLLLVLLGTGLAAGPSIAVERPEGATLLLLLLLGLLLLAVGVPIVVVRPRLPAGFPWDGGEVVGVFVPGLGVFGVEVGWVGWGAGVLGLADARPLAPATGPRTTDGQGGHQDPRKDAEEEELSPGSASCR
jgi:hypothetical protein